MKILEWFKKIFGIDNKKNIEIDNEIHTNDKVEEKIIEVDEKDAWGHKTNWVNNTSKIDHLPNFSGVYAYVVKGVVMYVGQGNVKNRISTHNSFGMQTEVRDLDFRKFVNKNNIEIFIELDSIETLKEEATKNNASAWFYVKLKTIDIGNGTEFELIEYYHDKGECKFNKKPGGDSYKRNTFTTRTTWEEDGNPGDYFEPSKIKDLEGYIIAVSGNFQMNGKKINRSILIKYLREKHKLNIREGSYAQSNDLWILGSKDMKTSGVGPAKIKKIDPDDKVVFSEVVMKMIDEKEFMIYWKGEIYE